MGFFFNTLNYENSHLLLNYFFTACEEWDISVLIYGMTSLFDLFQNDRKIATYIHTYIHTHIYTYKHTSIHTYIHTYLHTHIHTYIYTYIYTYKHTYLHACMHTHI